LTFSYLYNCIQLQAGTLKAIAPVCKGVTELIASNCKNISDEDVCEISNHWGQLKVPSYFMARCFSSLPDKRLQLLFLARCDSVTDDAFVYLASKSVRLSVPRLRDILFNSLFSTAAVDELGSSQQPYGPSPRYTSPCFAVAVEVAKLKTLVNIDLSENQAMSAVAVQRICISQVSLHMHTSI
jgi:hypothetical protein